MSEPSGDRAARQAGRDGDPHSAPGLSGVLVPCENTTVEPELSVLVSPGLALYAARMTSGAATLAGRLAEYGSRLPDWCGSFGSMPLAAMAFACTGTSYLTGRLETPLPASVLVGRRDVPLVTAAGALGAALAEISATRLALVSPYPDDLGEAAASYWRARGFEVAAVVGLAPPDHGHRIYGQTPANIRNAIRTARGLDCDAVVALGTGAPTLGAIAAEAAEPGPPTLSSNLALAMAIERTVFGASPIAPWLCSDAPWAARLAARFPSALVPAIPVPGPAP